MIPELQHLCYERKTENKVPAQHSVDSSTLVPLCQPTGGVVTRGHSLKLQKRDCISARANVHGFRIVNFWNDLPRSRPDLRPISVTRVFSRITERLVMRDFFLPVIPDECLRDQFAYKITGSTTSALVCLTDTV